MRSPRHGIELYLYQYTSFCKEKEPNYISEWLNIIYDK